ncbi:MAG: transposase [Candidatus Pacearchaeota archaeon]|nr:transposase [Candidatus Pacearchaeota archaeon]
MIKKHINYALDLSDDKYKITGYELLPILLEAVTCNTYIETISNKTDTLYLRCKESLISTMEYAYLNYIKGISNKLELNKKPVILAFDYTDEDFYGEVQGFDIHGWTGEHGVTGKFKFLICSIVSDDIPEKIPLISVPIKLGHYKSSVILHCLSMIKDYIGEIKLILFDRGFYDNDLMYELTKMKYPFLIFVPKRKEYKQLFEELEEEKTIFVHDYTFKKDMSTWEGETYLAFLKQIYDPKSDKNYDWIFATNVEKIVLSELLATYKKRWRIETQFRVQDEARIKCKSTDMKIRYFFFMFEQMLQTIWICFYKDEVPFKKFLIELSNTAKKWVNVQDKK